MNKIILERKPDLNGEIGICTEYEIVLCYLPDNCPTHYCVWTRKIEDDTYFWGNYTDKITTAIKTFNKKGLQRGI